MKTQTKRLEKGFTLIELLVVITIIAILASAAVPTFNTVQERANQSNAVQNAKQIVTALRIYSGDQSGVFPDGDSSAPADSNSAFRLLFVNGVISDEKIFTCKGSKYVPDGNIGAAPAYNEAVANGENHWAMTGGLTDTSASNTPLVYENPVTAAWPPNWNVDAAGQRTKGRAWKGGKIVVANADASSFVMPLASASGGTVAPKAQGTGTDPFTAAAGTATYTVLDIVE